MALSRLFNACMMVILLLVTLLLVRVQISMVRDSIHDQMAANLETASTSLGLVLQGAFLGGDPVMAETIVNAMFDGGYVKSIRLVDPDGKELFKREFADDQASAPDWLVHFPAPSYPVKLPMAGMCLVPCTSKVTAAMPMATYGEPCSRSCGSWELVCLWPSWR